MTLFEVIVAMCFGGLLFWLFTGQRRILQAAATQSVQTLATRSSGVDDASCRLDETPFRPGDDTVVDDEEILSVRQFTVSVWRAQRVMAFEARFRVAIPAYVLIPSFEWDERFHQLFDKGCGNTRGDIALRYNHLGQRYGLFVPHAVVPLCIVDFYLPPYDLIRFPPPCLHDDGLPIVSFSDCDSGDDGAVQQAIATALAQYLAPSFVRAPAE